FLPDMAGSPVFRAAQKSVWLLWVMAYVQSLLHRVSPDFMYKMIFASAQSADQTLCQTPRFKDQIGRLIGRCLHGQRDEYRRDIMAYVTPWATEIPVAQMPVKLWHGTLDNWSPPAMSVALKSALGPEAQIKVCDGASHYSTLKIALDAISNVPATV
ncbi:MAG: alpha/beta fold hydrolase, partial [Planktomarina sp.]